MRDDVDREYSVDLAHRFKAASLAELAEIIGTLGAECVVRGINVAEPLSRAEGIIDGAADLEAMSCRRRPAVDRPILGAIAAVSAIIVLGLLVCLA